MITWSASYVPYSSGTACLYTTTPASTTLERLLRGPTGETSMTRLTEAF